MCCAKWLAAVGLVGIVVLGVGPALAAEIHVGKELVSRIEKGSNKAEFLKFLKTPDTEPKGWIFSDVKIIKAKMTGLGFKLDMPTPNLEFITGEEVINCRPLKNSRTVEFNESVTNSSTMSNSQTFGYGVEVSVEASFLFGKAGAKASTTGSFNNSNASTHSETKGIRESITVEFPAERAGIVSALFADRLDVKSIPYSGTVRPRDDSEFEISVETKPGHVCMRTGVDFRGDGSCNAIGQDRKRSAPDMKVYSIQIIDGRAKVTLWDQPGYTGNKKEFHTAAASLGDWAGKARSYEIAAVPPVKVTRKVTFLDLKPFLSATDQGFAVTGTIDLSSTNVASKKIINYDMDPSDFERACAAVNPRPSSAGGPIASGGPKARSVGDDTGGIVKRKVSPIEFKALQGKLKQK